MNDRLPPPCGRHDGERFCSYCVVRICAIVTSPCCPSCDDDIEAGYPDVPFYEELADGRMAAHCCAHTKTAEKFAAMIAKRLGRDDEHRD